MNRFMTLFWSHRELDTSEREPIIAREFRAAVGQTPMVWWTDNLPPVQRRLVIGAATYSRYEMCMLDLVAETLIRENARRIQAGGSVSANLPAGALAYVQVPSAPLRVEVFSTLNCLSQSDFQKYIPGIERVLQTPVVGYYEDGALRETATGAAGRALVGRVCGFDPALTIPSGDAPCDTTAAGPTSSAR
jgi:hypothetical protein